MDRPRRNALALALVLAVVLAGCRGAEDSAETVGPAAGSDTTDTTDAAGPATTATDGTDTTEGTAGGELGIDGATSVEGTVAGTTPTAHEVVVPDGVQATITVTPGDDYDIVAEGNGDTVDSGLSGEPEVVTVTGPATFTLDVSGYYEDAAGPYTVTIEAG